MTEHDRLTQWLTGTWAQGRCRIHMPAKIYEYEIPFQAMMGAFQGAA